jgi:hypothetical protein
MKYKPILAFFQGFEPLFGSWDPRIRIKVTGRIRIRIKVTSKTWIRIRINVMRIRFTGN